MDRDEQGSSTTSTTGVAAPGKADSQQLLVLPLMSYTAVTSDREMASGFVRQLLQAAAKMIPAREWSVQDLRDILTFVIEGGVDVVPMLEGRYLRKRLKEQLARAERYQEPFSLMFIGVGEDVDQIHHQSLVDLLGERLRRSDMVFLYRRKAAIILPHTNEKAAEGLIARIRSLATATIPPEVQIEVLIRTYPHADFPHPADVLDWAEDQLR
jgi:GGDEF domain-containing protein